MNTTAFELRALRVSDLLAALTYQPMQLLRAVLRAPAPLAPESAQQLLELADSYEATQPSYAADLRAAAAGATTRQ
jgi:hypothetical protein